MATVTVKLPEELKQGLMDAARRRGTTSSRLLRDAAQDIVSRRSRGGPRTLLDLSVDLCGVVDDAPPDLSTNREYMSDFGK